MEFAATKWADLETLAAVLRSCYFSKGSPGLFHIYVTEESNSTKEAHFDNSTWTGRAAKAALTMIVLLLLNILSPSIIENV